MTCKIIVEGRTGFLQKAGSINMGLLGVMHEERWDVPGDL